MTLYRDATFARESVGKMNDAIAHRGPDAHGIWQGSQVTLGHRRLSILDTSAAGNQPFHSADGRIALVFNGEVYNYLELKNELSNYAFQTGTDTEVVIAAYQHWGIGCIDRFIGMFAFALWDEAQQVLYVVRDRMGIKPVYYTHQNQGFAFSSELRSLLKSGLVNARISESGLHDFLSYQTVHCPSTIIDGVQMLQPGHYLEIKRNTIIEREYWNLCRSIDPQTLSMSEPEVKEEIRRLLKSSIELRMRADVPFGAFLSGGIDSSIVVGLMSEVATKPVNTFSVTFHEKEYDEGDYSKMIAERFGTHHTEIKLSANDFLDALPEALDAMDHPSGDGPNTYTVSKVTRAAGVKMALSGLGGDEVFAGYDVFKRMYALSRQSVLKHTPHFIRYAAGKGLFLLKPGIATQKIAAALCAQQLDFPAYYAPTRRLMFEKELRQLLVHDGSAKDAVLSIATEVSSFSLPQLSTTSAAEMKTYMLNVLLRDTDQMSMAHALEVRVPFLDHRLVSFVLGVSDEIKYPKTPKQLLTSSFDNMIPSSIIHRPKMGFTFPWKMWMKNELRSFSLEQLQFLSKHSLLSEKGVMAMWDAFLKEDPMTPWSRVWPMVVLGYWMKKNNVS